MRRSSFALQTLRDSLFFWFLFIDSLEGLLSGIPKIVLNWKIECDNLYFPTGEQKMKKFSLFCFTFLLSIAVNAFGTSLHTYQELSSAVRAGDRLVLVLKLQECTGNSNMPIGYFTPSKMMLVPASATSSERIMTSDLHFTDHTGSPSYEYTKYTFNPDNSVVVRTMTYDPLTFKPIKPEHVINCALDKGVSIAVSEH